MQNREGKITKNPKMKKKKSKTVFLPNFALHSEMKKDAVNIIMEISFHIILLFNVFCFLYQSVFC